ncbi:MAG: helix-turn-helix transcriptional regulator, partial [Verrucomicrobia bacterium]|nr:helix-turn-helix transcriptional regulator [Verrucomicrobiota bacterium]
MALGSQLHEARRKRNLTASEVAAGTRVKVQFIEALENEDFDKFPAPIYGKGFIKLYAEYVGLDPRPLIDEYIDISSPKAPGAAHDEDEPAPSVAASVARSSEAPDKTVVRPGETYDLFNETGEASDVSASMEPAPEGPGDVIDWSAKREAAQAGFREN